VQHPIEEFSNRFGPRASANAIKRGEDTIKVGQKTTADAGIIYAPQIVAFVGPQHSDIC